MRIFTILVLALLRRVCSFVRSSPSRTFQPEYSHGEPETTVVLLYNKPKNIVTTHDTTNDPLNRTNVYDDVQSMKGYRGSVVGARASFEQCTGIRSRLHAVGRLDTDTSGLLLLTNDGGLVHHVTNKNAHSVDGKPIKKTYEALIMGYHEVGTSELLNQMTSKGVDIGPKYGGMTDPVEGITILSHPTSKTTLVSLTIVEGRNRQIRRMFHALGSGVMKLRRTRIGDHLSLEGIEEEGCWRILSDDEVVESLRWEPRFVSSLESYEGRTRRTTKKPKSRRRTRRS